MSRFDLLPEALHGQFGEFVARVSTRGPRQIRMTVPPALVPEFTKWMTERFETELVAMIGDDRRDDLGRFEVHYVFAQPVENWFLIATVPVDPADPVIVSLAAYQYPASRFEREIFDLFGIRAFGHLDPRPLVRHGFWPDDYFPLRKDSVERRLVDDGRQFPFGQVEGEGVFEIPVGPVHAGVIEPGHFRFSVVGETIIDMKSRLYFTHKGTEKLFEGRTPAEGIALAERISGDTTIGHALAYSQAIEAATLIDVPPRAQYLRVVLLELERIYNHIGDVGMIANDTGFAVAQAHCARLREQMLALNKRVSGSRLLRGVVCPGGLAVDPTVGWGLEREVAGVVADFDGILEIILGNTMVMDRLEGTGRLFTTTATAHGVRGFVARASGIDRDVRRDHPFAAYGGLRFDVPVVTTGDVKARTLVRAEEVRQSARLIQEAIERLPEGPVAVPVPPLTPFEPAFSMVEGWRGAIFHWVMAGADRRLYRVKVIDPSFFNWRPLSYALKGNIVPDFPLCNKSFNQSYAGNDL